MHRGDHAECTKLRNQAMSDIASLSETSVLRWGGTALSGGVQELIEALLFEDFLTPAERSEASSNDSLSILSYQAIKSAIPHGDIVVPMPDYIQGILDFTGEVMKYGVTHTRTEVARTIAMLRGLAVAMDQLAPYAEAAVKGFGRKHEVMRQSLAKIERQVYNDALNRQQQKELQEAEDRDKSTHGFKRARLENEAGPAIVSS